jgi:2-polyprenyl-6-hydroxyphenyl methylase/3-demethylubiquinone-9 3-methyltransferase
MNSDGNLNATTAFFSEAAAPFADNYATNACFRDRLDLFLQTVQRTTPPGGRVLDFGCGPGVIALAVAQQGYDLTGLDGASGMVETARQNAASRKIGNARFEHVDVSQFDPSIGPFDTVVCSSVIEYIEDDLGLLKKLISALRPGGHLIVSVPHGANVFTPLEPVAHAVKLRLAGKKEGHLEHTRHCYSRAVLQRQLQEMGLTDIHCTSFECPVLGGLGIKLSRWSLLARMLLFDGRNQR